MAPKKKAAAVPKRTVDEVRNEYEPKQLLMRQEILALKEAIETATTRHHASTIDLELARDRNVVTEGKLDSKREVVAAMIEQQRGRIAETNAKTEETKGTARIKNIRVQMLSRERDEYAANRKVPEKQLKQEQLQRDLDAFYRANPHVVKFISDRDDAIRTEREMAEAAQMFAQVMEVRDLNEASTAATNGGGSGAANSTHRHSVVSGGGPPLHHTGGTANTSAHVSRVASVMNTQTGSYCGGGDGVSRTLSMASGADGGVGGVVGGPIRPRHLSGVSIITESQQQNNAHNNNVFNVPKGAQLTAAAFAAAAQQKTAADYQHLSLPPPPPPVHVDPAVLAALDEDIQRLSKQIAERSLHKQQNARTAALLTMAEEQHKAVFGAQREAAREAVVQRKMQLISSTTTAASSSGSSNNNGNPTPGVLYPSTRTAVIGKDSVSKESHRMKTSAPLQLTYIHGVAMGGRNSLGKRLVSSYGKSGGGGGAAAGEDNARLIRDGVLTADVTNTTTPCDDLVKTLQLTCGFVLSKEEVFYYNRQSVTTSSSSTAASAFPTAAALLHTIRTAYTSPTTPFAVPLVVVEAFVKTRRGGGKREGNGEDDAEAGEENGVANGDENDQLVVVCNPSADPHDSTKALPLSRILAELVTAAPEGWDQSTLVMELTPADDVTMGLGIMAHRGSYLKCVGGDITNGVGGKMGGIPATSASPSHLSALAKGSIVFQYKPLPSLFTKVVVESCAKVVKLRNGTTTKTTMGSLEQMWAYSGGGGAPPRVGFGGGGNSISEPPAADTTTTQDAAASEEANEGAVPPEYEAHPTLFVGGSEIISPFATEDNLKHNIHHHHSHCYHNGLIASLMTYLIRDSATPTAAINSQSILLALRGALEPTAATATSTSASTTMKTNGASPASPLSGGSSSSGALFSPFASYGRLLQPWEQLSKASAAAAVGSAESTNVGVVASILSTPPMLVAMASRQPHSLAAVTKAVSALPPNELVVMPAVGGGGSNGSNTQTAATTSGISPANNELSTSVTSAVATADASAPRQWLCASRADGNKSVFERLRRNLKLRLEEEARQQLIKEQQEERERTAKRNQLAGITTAPSDISAQQKQMNNLTFMANNTAASNSMTPPPYAAYPFAMLTYPILIAQAATTQQFRNKLVVDLCGKEERFLYLKTSSGVGGTGTSSTSPIDYYENDNNSFAIASPLRNTTTNSSISNGKPSLLTWMSKRSLAETQDHIKKATAEQKANEMMAEMMNASLLNGTTNCNAAASSTAVAAIAAAPSAARAKLLATVTAARAGTRTAPDIYVFPTSLTDDAAGTAMGGGGGVGVLRILLSRKDISHYPSVAGVALFDDQRAVSRLVTKIFDSTVLKPLVAAKLVASATQSPVSVECTFIAPNKNTTATTKGGKNNNLNGSSSPIATNAFVKATTKPTLLSVLAEVDVAAAAANNDTVNASGSPFKTPSSAQHHHTSTAAVFGTAFATPSSASATVNTNTTTRAGGYISTTTTTHAGVYLITARVPITLSELVKERCLTEFIAALGNACRDPPVSHNALSAIEEAAANAKKIADTNALTSPAIAIITPQQMPTPMIVPATPPVSGLVSVTPTPAAGESGAAVGGVKSPEAEGGAGASVTGGILSNSSFTGGAAAATSLSPTATPSAAPTPIPARGRKRSLSMVGASAPDITIAPPVIPTAPLTHIAAEQPWVFLNNVTIAVRDSLGAALVQQVMREMIAFDPCIMEKEVGRTNDHEIGEEGSATAAMTTTTLPPQQHHDNLGAVARMVVGSTTTNTPTPIGQGPFNHLIAEIKHANAKGTDVGVVPIEAARVAMRMQQAGEAEAKKAGKQPTASKNAEAAAGDETVNAADPADTDIAKATTDATNSGDAADRRESTALVMSRPQSAALVGISTSSNDNGDKPKLASPRPLPRNNTNNAAGASSETTTAGGAPPLAPKSTTTPVASTIPVPTDDADDEVGNIISQAPEADKRFDEDDYEM